MENHTTQVTTHSTIIKYYNEKVSNEVQEIIVVGKLTTAESKNYINENDLGLFIDKSAIKETFNVNTIALMQLKEVL